MARILVVDDDEMIRDTLCMMLVREGYEVCQAVDGSGAISKHKKCPFDLIITDIIMPEMEGIETIFKIREFSPSTAIIAISGGAIGTPEQLLEIARSCGADVSFAKPFDRKELVGSISHLLAQPSLL